LSKNTKKQPETTPSHNHLINKEASVKNIKKYIPLYLLFINLLNKNEITPNTIYKRKLFFTKKNKKKKKITLFCLVRGANLKKKSKILIKNSFFSGKKENFSIKNQIFVKKQKSIFFFFLKKKKKNFI